MLSNIGRAAVQGSVSSYRDMIAHSLALMVPVHLCAFPQDGGNGNGAYFGNDIADATEFAFFKSEQQFNVYWSVNEPTVDCGIKPKKEQIRVLRFAHLDLDPPKDGTPFDKAAALAAINADKPTFVVDSGNGWHAYWRLADPQNATSETVAAVEGVNRAIIHRHNGDGSTWNADRILRVPGTVNWPNEKKRLAGRLPQPVVLL